MADQTQVFTVTLRFADLYKTQSVIFTCSKEETNLEGEKGTLSNE